MMIPSHVKCNNYSICIYKKNGILFKKQFQFIPDLMNINYYAKLFIFHPQTLIKVIHTLYVIIAYHMLHHNP
jgi:hypothetical protein